MINQIESFKKIETQGNKKAAIIKIHSSQKDKINKDFNKDKKKTNKSLGKTLWVRRKNKSN